MSETKVLDKRNPVDLKNAAILGVLGNSRTYRQYVEMYTMFQTGECLFCNLDKLKYPVIFQVGKWAVKKCDMPYNNCEYHLILVYTGGHVTDWDLLSREDDADFMEAIKKAKKMFGIKGCAVVFRQGDASYHAGTISHIHGHIMVVKLDEDGLPVGELRAYFAKTREEITHCRKMVELFERVRTRDITGAYKGYAVFDEFGNYLTIFDSWIKCNTPQSADLLKSSLEELRKICVKKRNIQYYEMMTSNETGAVIVDGPHAI